MNDATKGRKPALNPAELNRMRAEVRQELLASGPKELMLAAAVDSRVAVTVLYDYHQPAIEDLDRRLAIMKGVLMVVAVGLPIVFSALTLILGRGA